MHQSLLLGFLGAICFLCFILAMFLFFCGEDVYRSREKLNEMKSDFHVKNPNSSVGIFDFEEGKSDLVMKLKNTIISEGLFSDKKFIVVEKIFSCEKSIQDDLVDFLEERNYLKDDQNTKLLFWEDTCKVGKGKLVNFLGKNAQKHNFEKLRGRDISEWIKSKVNETEDSTKIDENAIAELVTFVGDDMSRLSNEVEKLITFKMGEVITKDDVDLLVKSKIEANIFDTIEALGYGKKNIALERLHKQLEKGDDPLYIFSMYVYQFRNLLKIGSIYFEGNSNPNEIAKLAKLHPFVVKKGMGQLRGFSLSALRDVYQKLKKLDVEIKTGKMDVVTGLDKFIVEL